MALSVGAITVLTMSGRPPEPAPLIESIDRAGRDGAELRDLGLREVPCHIRTIQTATNDTTAAASEAANLALEGTIVTVTDVWATAHTGCLIERADVTIRAVVSPANEPTHTRAIFTTWTIKKLYTAPVV